MKKYNGNLIGFSYNLEVTRIMQEVGKNAYAACTNCPHHNGECDEWARSGKCRMYNLHSEKFRIPKIRCTACMRHFFSNEELLKVKETAYSSGRIDYHTYDGGPLAETDEYWEQVINACPDCMTDDYLLDLDE